MSIRISLVYSVIIYVMISCNSSDYDRMVKEEMSKNVTYDSLFLGIEMGMGKKDFYTHCWKMNKQGLIRQGPNNLSVQYNIDSGELNYQGYMHFYPEFEADTISVMPMQFTYEAFIPSDTSYHAQSLLLDVKTMLERWYGGNDFIYLEDDEGLRGLWVKVDGNRRIRIFRKDIRTVAADIQDLRNVLAVEK